MHLFEANLILPNPSAQTIHWFLLPGAAKSYHDFELLVIWIHDIKVIHFVRICNLTCIVHVSVSSFFLQNMLSLWNVSSLTMIAFWPHLSIDDFLLLSSSNIQTPGMSKYVLFWYQILSSLPSLKSLSSSYYLFG